MSATAHPLTSTLQLLFYLDSFLCPAVKKSEASYSLGDGVSSNVQVLFVKYSNNTVSQVVVELQTPVTESSILWEQFITK